MGFSICISTNILFMIIYVFSKKMDVLCPWLLFSFWALIGITFNVHISSMHLKALPASTDFLGFPVAQTVKNLPAMQENWIQTLGWEDPLEEGMVTHSSVLAWRIPWTEDPGRLQSMGLKETKSWTQMSN